ncbi:hypothetical protein FPOA_00090 [Fusarium poae]|uniref:ZZ-type domain-containing protein n=1 Tax=Fusarium poae TaxID=36050 RepID=A0A1B8B089_FUSPO|nr:hypothetical protein FPOA_00090 [Fusarium poae]
MSARQDDHVFSGQDYTNCVNVELYETGEGALRIFNLAPNDYHRPEVLERTGAVDITCYLEKVIHGVLSPTEYGSIIVMQWFFQPGPGRRISEAVINLLFEVESSDSDTELEVRDISFEGTYSLIPTTQLLLGDFRGLLFLPKVSCQTFPHPTTQQIATTRGVEATAGVQEVAQANLTAKWERTTTATISDSITLNGGKRLFNHTPPKRIAKWELFENKSQPHGIPSMLKVALLVARDDEEKFQCRVDFACKTDLKTKLAGIFQKIPKDDPIIFQPDGLDKACFKLPKQWHHSPTYHLTIVGSFTDEKSGDAMMELPDIHPDKQSNPAVEPLEDLVTEKTLNEESRLPQKSQDETEELDDDLISIQTETDILLPIEKDSEIPVQEHKLGLDINAIRGWSGSQYDDYDVIAVHGIRDDYKTAWMDKKGGWVLKERLFKGLSIREIDYSYEIDENSILYQQNGIGILAESLLDSYAKEREHLAGTETDRPIIWACHDIGGTIVKQIKNLLHECHQIPQLARSILQWLNASHRGKNRDEIAAVIASLSPATAGNIVRVFLKHLPPVIQKKAQTAFTWIQHAMEPWSADALVEAVALHTSPETEPYFCDLDKKDEVDELVEALGGIIIVENGDVKFCHPSFYQVTELIEGQEREEFVTRIHSSIATVCLRYFQLESAQSFLDDLILTKVADNHPEAPLEPFVIYHKRSSMSEYAVRFWAEHYKASGSLKPKGLVLDLFGDKRYRARWEIPFWIMSNPFTRIGRHYISMLPIFAMLGLEDLIDDEIMSRCDDRWFNKDCWFAIVEAIRWGNTRIGTRLLGHAEFDEAELQVALLWAAAQNDQEIIQDLLAKIPNMNKFYWPESLIHRAVAMGQDRLLSVMLTSGCDINKVGIYWDAPPAINAAWRNQVSTLEMLLTSETKLDLSLTDSDGDTLLMVATRGGNPDLLELVTNAVSNGAGMKATKYTRKELVQAALWFCSHKALDLILKSGIGCRERVQDSVFVTAADDGFLECVHILVSHGFVPDKEDSAGTALYNAVSKGYVDIVRLLLKHDPEPKMDITPPGKNTLLAKAISSGNNEIASLLIEHGASVDAIDDNDTFAKTPLSKACAVGNLEMVKLLLENNADVNYTVGLSHSPLFSALYNWNSEVAKYLLANTEVDVMWTTPGNIGMLHAAHGDPEILGELLKRGVPIDGVSSWGTVLNVAAYFGEPDSIKVLLNNDPKPDLDVKALNDLVPNGHQGYTPLQSACKECSFESVDILLAAGANPHIINKVGEDVVDILLQAPSESEDCERLLRLLFSAPYNMPKERVDEGGRTRLHRIQESTSIHFVRRLTCLISELDIKDKEGYTPLAVAASKGNTDVARYLIELGAKVNIFSSKFGSILHLAVRHGTIDLAKLLISSGTDPEMVEPQYGESLMYAALEISTSECRNRMVRYLADEVKVSIERLGGEFGYPVILAASMTRQPTGSGAELLKFFIRRNARLDVTDNQTRSAIHFLSRSSSLDLFKIVLRDRSMINAVDKFGRMPIHFAASNPDPAYLEYLLDIGTIADIDVKDLDQWTPLMWAARSGSKIIIERLLSEKADIWAHTRSLDSRDGWSPLKLARFAGRSSAELSDLEPQERSRVRQDGTVEVWDEYFHKSKAGDAKEYHYCDSCLVTIIGLRWTCTVCKDSYDLCFKCFPNRSGLHDMEHNFESIGPLYREDVDGDSVKSHDTEDGALSVDEGGLILDEDNANGIDDLDSDADS